MFPRSLLDSSPVDFNNNNRVCGIKYYLIYRPDWRACTKQCPNQVGAGPKFTRVSKTFAATKPIETTIANANGATARAIILVGIALLVI